MDSSSHSTTSSLLDHSFHNLLVSATHSRERVSSSWSQFLDWQTLNVDDSLDSDSENYQQSRLSIPHGFCCSGVGGFRAALLSGQLSDDDLEVLFTRSRKFLLIGIHGERLFNPRSIYMFGWQFLNLVCTILCALFVPIEVAFLSHDGILSTQLIGAFFEVFFILDMILNFNLPIYNKDNGSLIGNRESIRAEYFKHWFWIDLVSSLPLDVCELSLGMDRILSVPGFFDLVRVIRVLKIFKLLRLLRTDSILRSLQNHITFKQLELQSLKLLFLILIAIHSMSCGLFIVAEWEDTYSNWIEENHIAGATPLVQYACAVYWATMTSTTIGYGDIVMVTAFERTYATICMIIGASVYAFITSKLVGMLIFAPSANSSPTVMTDNNTILGKFYQSPLVHQAILMDYLNNRQVNQANDGTRDYFLVSKSSSSHSLFPPTLPPFLHLPLAQLLSPRLRSLIAKTYYAEMVVYTQLLCPRHLTPHLLEEICGDVALVIEHETFMPGEIVVDKYDPQISPREYLYIVNNGGILLRRGSSLQTLSRSMIPFSSPPDGILIFIGTIPLEKILCC
jgi:hypothetical protein